MWKPPVRNYRSLPVSQWSPSESDEARDEANKNGFVAPPPVITTDAYTLSSGWESRVEGDKAMSEIRNKLKETYTNVNFEGASSCAGEIMEGKYRTNGIAAPLGGYNWKSYRSRDAERLIVTEKCLIDMEIQNFLSNYLRKKIENAILAGKIAKQKALNDEALSGPLINLRTPEAVTKNANLITFPSRNEELKGLYGGKRRYLKKSKLTRKNSRRTQRKTRKA